MSEKKPDRSRFVYRHWVRDPKGKLLEKPPPKGARPANDIIWGHSLNDFYWISRIPGINILTIWSRSMIKEYGENFLDEEHDEEPEPRRLRPWPSLTLPDHLAAGAALGYIDEGCDSMHGNSLRRIQDEVVPKPKVVTKYMPEKAGHDIQPSSTAASSSSPVEATAVPLESAAPPEKSTVAATVSSSPDSPTPAIPIAVSPDDAPAAAPTEEDATAPLPNPIVASATEALAHPDQPMAIEVDTNPAAAPDQASDVGSPAPASMVLVSPADGSLRTTSWMSDNGDWNEATTVLPQDSGTPVNGAAATGTACMADASIVPEAPAPTASNGPAAASLDADAPKIGDSAEQEEKPSEATACAAEPAPEAPVAAAHDAAADTMVVDPPKIDGDVKEMPKPKTRAQLALLSKSRWGAATGKDADGAEVKDSQESLAVRATNAGPAAVDPSLLPTPLGTNDAVTAAKGDANASGAAPSPPIATSEPVKPVTPPASEPEAAPVVSKAPVTSPPPPPPTPEPPVFHNLPMLEEFIPEEYFPDILYVNDPDRATMNEYYYSQRNASRPQSREPVPRKYKRVWPRFARDTEPATAFNTDVDCASIKLSIPPSATSAPSPAPPTSRPTIPGPETNLRIAHLNLSGAPLLGVGNHSVVHRAALRLPRPLSARSPTGEVTVAAKAGFSGGEARQLLLNEGKFYDAFPKHLQEGWCGMNLVAPILHPVPVGAVVPKFYGYYVPVREDVERAKQEAVCDWVEKKKEGRRKEKERRLEERRSRVEARELKKAEKAEKAAAAAEDNQNVDEASGQREGNSDPATGAIKAEEQEQTTEPIGTVGDGGKPSTKAAVVDSFAMIEDEVDEDDDDEEDEEDETDAVKSDEMEGLRRFKCGPIYKSWYQMSPLLLLEECGSPIVSSRFTADERSECYSLALRLHYAEFTQNSFYVRNILRQPGPLTVAPSARSDSTPSFRIIDFGRGEHWQYQLEAAKKQNEERRQRRAKIGTDVPTEKEMKRRIEAEEAAVQTDKKHLEQARKSYWELRDYEVRKAHSELQIRDFDY